MKTIAGIIIGICIAGFIHLLSPRCMNSTDLEIYTVTNIYYVNGLHLTDETGVWDITFNTRKELKEWLSTRTADETNLIKQMR